MLVPSDSACTCSSVIGFSLCRAKVPHPPNKADTHYPERTGATLIAPRAPA